MSVRCLSSQCMERLLAWRNTQGSEENWNDAAQAQDHANDRYFLGRKIVALVGGIFLQIGATIESVALVALAVLFSPLYPCTKSPHRFFAKCLESSVFTIFWCLDNTGWCLVCQRVPTQESFMRMFIDNMEAGIAQRGWVAQRDLRRFRYLQNGQFAYLTLAYLHDALLGPVGMISRIFVFTILYAGIHLVRKINSPQWTRPEDNTYTQAWLQQHRPAETLQHFQTVSMGLDTLIEPRRNVRLDLFEDMARIAGMHANNPPINFDEVEALIAETVQGNNDLLEEFEAMSPEIIELITVKAIFTYVLGKNKNAPIPHCFQVVTAAAISMMRENLSSTSENEIIKMEELFLSLDAYSSLVGLDENIRKIIIDLKGLASEEMQGNDSVFIKNCLQNAYKTVFPSPSAASC